MTRLNVLFAVPLAIVAGVGFEVLSGRFRQPALKKVLLACFLGLSLSSVLFVPWEPSIQTVDGGGWLSTLSWVGRHPGIYVAWWDYGYWLQGAGATTLCDGQTCIAENIRDVATMYAGSPESARELMGKWGVNYIVVTEKTIRIRRVLEANSYEKSTESTLDKIPEWLSLVYESGGIKIYALTSIL